MAIGIEIIGGGQNKFTRTSVSVEGEDSKGIVTKDSVGNEFEDVQVFVGSSIEKLKKMQSDIYYIQDNSMNYKTGNKYRDDVLEKLTDLTDVNNEAIVNKGTLNEVSSLLSNWITIKNELTTQLTPFIFLIQTMLGG